MRLIERPLEVIDESFSAAVSKNKENFPESLDLNVAFKDVLSSGDSYINVPWLTREGLARGTVTNGSLVRFRAMIQDVLDPEYFARSYVTAQNRYVTSMYTDMVVSPDDTELTQVESHGLGERLPVYCISAPCETSWSASRRGQSYFTDSITTVRSCNKRVSADMNVSEGSTESTLKKGNIGIVENTSNLKGSDGLESVRSSFPITMKPEDIACIVKLYDQDMTVVQLNDMVEIVGVLHTAPMEMPKHLEDAFMELEMSARHPPSSVVPRLHCLSLIKSPQPTVLVGEVDFQKQRQEILSSITSVLGDALAAEYTLLWLLSQLIRREEEQFTIGTLSLALSCVDSEVARSMEILIRSLVPMFQEMHLSRNLLNEKPFTPSKCYETNRLKSSYLQVCNGTFLVIDETKMDPGQLNEQGINNLKALGQVAQHQTVTYDFQYFTKDWLVDIPALLLCDSKKPLVSGFNCILPVQRSNHTPEANQFVDRNLLRDYITMARRCAVTEFELSQQQTDTLENFFTTTRQQYRDLVAPESIHMWLNMARLMENSFGRGGKIGAENLARVFQMETERLKRRII